VQDPYLFPSTTNIRKERVREREKETERDRERQRERERQRQRKREGERKPHYLISRHKILACHYQV
jgi:hypothetical protein